MTFKVEAINVLISYPDSMAHQKEQVIKSLQEWNTMYSEQIKKELIPVVSERLNGEYKDKAYAQDCDCIAYIYEKEHHLEGGVNLLKVVDHEYSLELLTEDATIFFGNFPERNELKFKNIQKYNDVFKPLSSIVKNIVGNPERSIQVNTSKEISTSLSEEQQILLNFAIEQKNLFFYPKWISKQTINKIEHWENENSMNNSCIDHYDEILKQLTDLKLLNPREFTEYGNGRLFEMPPNILYQLSNVQFNLVTHD